MITATLVCNALAFALILLLIILFMVDARQDGDRVAAKLGKSGVVVFFSLTFLNLVTIAYLNLKG